MPARCNSEPVRGPPLPARCNSEPAGDQPRRWVPSGLTAPLSQGQHSGQILRAGKLPPHCPALLSAACCCCCCCCTAFAAFGRPRGGTKFHPAPRCPRGAIRSPRAARRCPRGAIRSPRAARCGSGLRRIYLPRCHKDKALAKFCGRTSCRRTGPTLPSPVSNCPAVTRTKLWPNFAGGQAAAAQAQPR